MSLKVRIIAFLAVTAVLCGGGYFYYRYRTFTRAFLNYSGHNTIAENRNLYFCLSYWFDFVGKLRLNEEGFYSFDGIAEENLDGFERGKLAYHRGDFGWSIQSIQRDISENGESESKLFWLAMSYMRQAEAENCLSKLLRPTQVADGPVNQEQHALHDHALLCALPLTQFNERAENTRTAAKLF